MLKASLEKLIAKTDLSTEETTAAIKLIINEAESHQVAAFLVLLQAKGITPDEMAGFVLGMRGFAKNVTLDYPLLDTCGTGGDGASTVNISTAAALLAAACGAKVAKHGNRHVSGICGSADVLEQLGINIDIPAEQVKQCIDKTNFGFFFAPNYHPAMKVLGPIRRSLGIPTVLNILGPLLNPAGTKVQLIGVYDESLLDLMAETLLRIGSQRALVVCGCGLDELSPIGPVQARELRDGVVTAMIIDAQSFGIDRCKVEDLRGGDPEVNADILQKVFAGKQGAVADAIILNAGFALDLYGIVESPQAGIDLAREQLQIGAVLNLLKHLQAFTQQAAGGQA